MSSHFEIKYALFKEGMDLIENVTWENFAETQLKAICWKIKVRKFINKFKGDAHGSSDR